MPELEYVLDDEPPDDVDDVPLLVGTVVAVEPESLEVDDDDEPVPVTLAEALWVPPAASAPIMPTVADALNTAVSVRTRRAG